MIESLESLKVDKILPPYPLGGLAEAVIRARIDGRDVIDLGQVNPKIPPPSIGVDKLVQSILRPSNHSYSSSQGIKRLRDAIRGVYKRHFNVEIDPNTECVSVMGIKEGLAHLLLAILKTGDHVLIPTPCYPLHSAASSISGATSLSVPLYDDENEFSNILTDKSEFFFNNLQKRFQNTWPRPKVLLLSFPNNPTTIVVEESFFSRIINFCKKNDLFIVHDFAYADMVFDEYKAPSILSISGAKELAVEFYSLSKAYGVSGWRVGFCVGNSKLVSALKKIKTYLDFGIFQPLQIASSNILENSESIVEEINSIYSARRDVLFNGLNSIGWKVYKPKATVFFWVKIPPCYNEKGSLDFSYKLLENANVSVSPGVGFGKNGDNYIRLSLMENEVRIRKAMLSIQNYLKSI